VSKEDQLAAVASLDELLGREALDYWLFGGWAVDFHAEEVTRAHDDVDIAVWPKLDGVHARVIGLRALKADKSETRSDALVAAKVSADVSTLSRLVH
jgi:hypothetical protein